MCSRVFARAVGRSFLQLTLLGNYQAAAKALNDPSLVTDPS
jgi:hypothetical protein